MTNVEKAIAAECSEILKELDYLSGIALPKRVYRTIDSIRQKIANIQDELGVETSDG